MAQLGEKTSFVQYTPLMDEQIDTRRKSKLYTWKDFYKITGIKGQVTTMDYWRRTGRISFSKLRKLLAL